MDGKHQPQVSSEFTEMTTVTGERLGEMSVEATRKIEDLFSIAYQVPNAVSSFHTESGAVSPYQEMVITHDEGDNDLRRHMFLDGQTGQLFERVEGEVNTTVVVRHQYYRNGPKSEDYFIAIDRSVPHTIDVFTAIYEFDFYTDGSVEATAHVYDVTTEVQGESMIGRPMTEYDMKELLKELQALSSHMELHHEVKALHDSFEADE